MNVLMNELNKLNQLYVNVIKCDGKTEKEAIAHLERGALVYSESEYLNYFDNDLVATYRGDVDDDDLEEQRDYFAVLYMDKGKDVDNSWVFYNDCWYFIQYVR